MNVPDPHLKTDKLNNEYVLTREYQLDYQGTKLRVPRLFSFNGASIPRLFWWLISTPFAPKVMAAATMHDWLYASHRVTRAEADTLFYYMLSVSGIPKWKQVVMYGALRVFGGWAWMITERDRIGMRRLMAHWKRQEKSPKLYLNGHGGWLENEPKVAGKDPS